MQALLIANALDADPGFVGDRFRHHGVDFAVCPREHPAEWPGLDGIDLVLTLGSDWSVYWPEVASSVAAEAELVRETDRRGIPLLGICFGNQVMAHALGGAVERSPVAEIGWYTIDTDVPDHVGAGPWMQWHYDRVTVPPSAVELARSELAPQAWVMGRSLAVQFHPEANEAIVSRWSTGAGAAELERFGTSSDELLERTRSSTAASRSQADTLVDWFLADVASRPLGQVASER